MTRILLAALHLVALGIGLGAVVVRGSALRGVLSSVTLRRAFQADTVWGVAALLWISTGLWRLFGETEKATGFYLSNHIFLAKMGMLVLILALELWPMITLIGWRMKLRRSSPERVVEAGAARRIATISHIQAALVIAMVVAAAAMARGAGAR